jgi:glycosyltransferase involved in cell wall biosynthesis
MLRYLRMVRDICPQIVHSHMLLSNLLVRATAIVSPKTVIVCQDHGLSPWKNRLLVGIDRLTSSVVARHITCSENSRQLRLHRERYRAEKIDVLYNGVDLAQFDPAQYRCHVWQGQAPMVVATVGTLKPVKDYETLLRAVSLLRRLKPSMDVRVHLYGDGPQQDELEALCYSMGISDRIKFLGRTREVARALAECHIFVMPSLREDLPVSLLEAMAMKRVCVASDVGGIPEVIEDGISGYLIPTHKPEAICARLEAIYGQQEHWQLVSNAARRRVEACFSLDVHLMKVLNIYSKIIPVCSFKPAFSPF